MTTHFTNVPTVNYDDSVQLRQRERDSTIKSAALASAIAFPSVVIGGAGLFNIVAASASLASSVAIVQSVKWDGTRLTNGQTQRNLLLARNAATLHVVNGGTTMSSIVADAFALQAHKSANSTDEMAQGMTTLGLTLLGAAAVTVTTGMVRAALRRRDLRQKEQALK